MIRTVQKFLLVLLFIIVPLRHAEAQRTRINFDSGWQFHNGDIAIKQAVKSGMQGGLTDANVKRVEGEEVIIAYTDRNKTIAYKESDWENVNIPHDWLVETAPVKDFTLGSQPGGNGFHPASIGFYRKEFLIPEESRGKRISIEFDGIFRKSTVWVNGHLMGHHESGYTPSFYDLSEVLRYGSEGGNVILVKVDATDYEGWWYEGAGIYRHSWLLTTDPLHIDRFGTFVTSPKVSSERAEVKLETTVRNEYDGQRNFILESSIFDSDGRRISRQYDTLSVCAGKTTTAISRADIVNPELWSPETPQLYRLESRIIADGKCKDTYLTTFGIRTAEVRQDGFYLNGRLYPVKGTANHQDHAGIGVALPDKMQEYRIRLLKEMGSNGYRSAHNPPTPEILDACDRLGMLVLDENRHLWVSEDGTDDLATLILRDRNHPSVFMWCIENEENLEGTVMGARLLKKLVDLAHSLDPTRQTTAAINHAWNEAGYIDQVDVAGYNYGQRGMQYVVDKEKYPERLMFVTESTSYVSTRGEYKDDADKGYLSNFGKGVSWGLQPGQDWKHIVLYPYLSGTFVWTGFDYRGEPTPYSWPCVSSHFGIMDLCGFPKDGYYGYKAAWDDTPIIHVYPHWNLKGMDGETVKMGIYTNCEEVELIVNGKSLGRRKAEAYERMEWDVIYKPGKIEVRGYDKGKLTAREINETSGPAGAIKAESDVSRIVADGKDLFIVNYTILDRKGRFVPDAKEKLEFTVSGPGTIIGTGNGDPSCHDPEKADWRYTFNGHCQVIVQSNGEPGTITLIANGVNLSPASVSVTAEAMRSFYVSNTGDDRNNGSFDAPFRTVGKAIANCRKIKDGDVHIYVRGGEYSLDKTIVLTPEDGNLNKHLFIEGYGDEDVTFSGARIIDCIWEKQADGIFRTSVSGMDGKPEMLTVDGTLRILARYPDYDPEGIRFNGTAADALSPERIGRWKSPEGAYLHAMHPADWGDFHYVVEGINNDGTASLKGGWQNNRPASPSKTNRMVENVREELDCPCEWYYDSERKELFYFPAPDENLSSARIGMSSLKHLVEFRGSAANPVRNIHIKGINLTMTERTFMEEYEPLLRSDWTVYRGAAVIFEGTENCSFESSELYNIGGNAVLFSSYNRNSKVTGCHIHDIGASAILFIGDSSSVRSACFNYGEYIDYDKLDKTPGPKNNLYPDSCIASDNLIHDIGMYEKQTTGVELSMCRRIEVSHNTIYHTPRAAINIGDGTWGGHLISGNDLFDTVRETGDHGSINAWGRDRFWHPDRKVMDGIVRQDKKLPFLDAMETTVIRNNRIRCDRGWDIDLDDGASNYLIENNLCLCGGIKLREGFKRIVRNNILINSSLHPHVWFDESGDCFTHNIVMRPYEPVNINQWGKAVDYNVFASESILDEMVGKYGTDTNSSVSDLIFTNPLKGNYTISNISGEKFVNFRMDDFGVSSPELRSLARHPELPIPIVVGTGNGTDTDVIWKGLRVKDLSTLGEQSATGMDSIRGILVLSVVDRYSALCDYMRPADVILGINGQEVKSVKDLKEDDIHEMDIFRNQKTVTVSIR